MNKLIFSLIFGIFLISLVSAETNPCGSTNEWLGRGAQGSPITLKQTCDTCSYVNISRINYPDSTFNSIESSMTKNGINYNYTFTDTFKLGCYSYTVYGDKDAVLTLANFDFQITPSGQGGSDNIALIIIVIVIVYGISLFGFFGKNEIMSMLGGLLMMVLGVYFITQGIVVYRDDLTTGIAYATIVLGFFFTMYPILEEYFDF